ncbi:hypothetical protein FEM48_Zijuj10G0120400 [Ziziphus jujuba var. spinosa]|uniref:Mediator of RNA polymerase II transcription subunit 23 n=1 Tax=Ziziphus jujuba var. spinosa TaxID=714518 RepID=A0A978UN96_ZIZJJ|nr:hypothetical protein FEM48_Zijuj10G0120400 [Ziziphus jujuba var. spinosa]
MRKWISNLKDRLQLPGLTSSIQFSTASLISYILQPPVFRKKAEKRVIAFNRELPPENEQFLLVFEEIQSQFADQEQLRAVTESVLISLVVQCSGHAPRAEFLLFALHSLCTVGCINWDTFSPTLLSSVFTAEMSIVQWSQTIPAVSSQPGILSSSNAIPNSSNFQSSNPAYPIPSIHAIGSPAHSPIEPSSCADFSPVKSSDISCAVQSTTGVNSSIRDNAISSLRQLCCKIILTGLEFNLEPVTHAEIFSHMLNWLVNWDQRQQGIDESDGAKSCRPDKALINGLQFLEITPDDEALFTIILEMHRRRDMMAMYMQMLDQHLHCPTFGTHQIFPQTTPHISGEAVASLRYSPITYRSVLGEPLHGEDLATSIQKGSLDWERAIRCIRHALQTTPSPEWWKRVLLVARCHKSPSQGPAAGLFLTSEMVRQQLIELLSY